MLKTMTQSKFRLLEKCIHPAWIKWLFLKLPFHQLEKGALTITLFQQSYRYEAEQEGHHADLHIVHPIRAYWLIRSQGELGFAQAYYEGAIDTSSLYHLMHFAQQNRHALTQLLYQKSANLWHLWQHRRRHNSMENSQENISFHYDLGNAFYSKWLDETMTYSSALFDQPNLTLAEAQHRKYARLLDTLNIQPNDTLLEIGCGWGGLMEAAIERGANVKGLTLSSEQRRYANTRLQANFAPNQYDVALQDYRLETHQYDHIVSIEMFEAVGKEYWNSYFDTLKRCLKTDGKASLQIITIDDDMAESYQADVDFIQKYIFPGGLLPSIEQLHTLASAHGFEVEQVIEFGQDYAQTCHHWKHSFNRQGQMLETLGYDKAFQRLWNYYLDYCIVGFESQHISVYQLTLTHQKDA